MLNFDYHNPTHIVFGKDRLGELDLLIPKKAKVLILYGGGSIKKFGTLQKVKDNLGTREVVEFAGIEPNPRFETLMEAVAFAKKEQVNFLLAVGGGSVADGAKFVNLAINYKGANPAELLTYRSVRMSVSTALGMGTVMTLPATGSEMNSGGVVSYNHKKSVFSNPLLYPVFSILDPTLTYTLPSSQVANGVVDAFIHTVEQYITYPVDARFQDRTAEGILQTLIEIGNETIDNPENYKARANLVWCATMALNGLIGSGVPQDWTTHLIGHELTAMFGIDHGRTLAILQPSVWHVRKEQKRAKLLQYAERVWHIEEEDEDRKINKAIDNTRDFFEGLGVKTRLTDYGVEADKIDDIVRALENNGFTALSETKDVDLEVSRTILENSL